MSLRFCLILIITSLCSACVSGPQQVVAAGTLRMLERKDIDGRDNFMGIAVQSGQLVLTESPGDLSFFFNLAPSKFFRFTHAAILIMEEGKPVIYDIAGELSTFKVLYTNSPTGAISGAVQRHEFFEYCKPNYVCAFYDPPADVDVDKMCAFVQKSYKEGKPFDPFFRWKDKENYYCTQFIAESIRAGGGKIPEFTPMNPNKSFQKAISWLEIPIEDTLPAGAFADPDRFVGTLSTYSSLSAIRGYYAAKRVIHERLTEDQRIGFAFSFDDLELRLRPKVDKFVKDAIKLVVENASSMEEEVDDELALSLVRGLADERLGYFESPSRKEAESQSETLQEEDG